MDTGQYADAATVGALWFTVAILAGGYARTRNRSPFAWFLLVLFLGPIAALFLVLLREVPRSRPLHDSPGVPEQLP